jgi:putative colanic acid biosynthesis acetyltransferase WcaF
LFVASWIPGSFHRRVLLQIFGARVASGVVIKPGVRVKFPWRLSIGANSWVGESVWIDNLGEVGIGENCCLSQGAYICTGSHDWSREAFNLVVKRVSIEDGAWIAAKAVIGPGVTVGKFAVVGLAVVVTKDVAPQTLLLPGQDVQVRHARTSGC